MVWDQNGGITSRGGCVQFSLFYLEAFTPLIGFLMKKRRTNKGIYGTWKPYPFVWLPHEKNVGQIEVYVRYLEALTPLSGFLMKKTSDK